MCFKITKLYGPCVVFSFDITREKCTEETGQTSVTDCERLQDKAVDFHACGLWVSLVVTIRVHVEIVHLILASQGVKPVETVHTACEGLLTRCLQRSVTSCPK